MKVSTKHKGIVHSKKIILTSKRRNCWTVFLAHKKYSRSFIKWMLKHWCHMGCFNNVLTAFPCLERVSSLAVYEESESSRISAKYLNLCSEEEQRSYVFGWTIPLNLQNSVHLAAYVWIKVITIMLGLLMSEGLLFIRSIEHSSADVLFWAEEWLFLQTD